MPPFHRLIILMVLAVLLVACGDGEDATTTTTGPKPSTTSSIERPSTTTEPAPEPNVQAEIDWFVAVLNGEQLTEAEYEERFNEEFRTQVPYTEGFRPVLQQFRPEAPYTVVERSGEGASGVTVIESVEGTRIRVLADLDDQGRFASLLLQPDEPPSLDDPPESVGEAFERLGEIGTVRAIAAEVVDDQCMAIEEVGAADPAPLGSIFKLYVLAALGEAIDAGEVAWDDEVVIRDELKSVPTGELQEREDGAIVTVREAAELMISISDNTAADHLIDLLGRETVEEVMADYGNTSPGLNTPFLNTREFTALKVGPASGLATQWLDGDETARRGILEQISDITPADLPIQEWVEPIAPEALEWFASPEDLCTLAIRLGSLADRVPEIDEILSINPGVPAEEGTWESVWFKGGSEPGLLAAWWVTESDGRVFVTAGSVVDPEAVVDGDQAVLLIAAARDLLAP